MFGTVFQVLAWICAATWFVWPFVFVGTLTGLIRRAVQRPENTAQEQRENTLRGWGFAAGFSCSWCASPQGASDNSGLKKLGLV